MCYYVARKAAAYDCDLLTRGKTELIVNILGNAYRFYAQRVEVVHRGGERRNLVIFAHDKIAHKAVEILAGGKNPSAFLCFSAFAWQTFAAGTRGLEVDPCALFDAVAFFARFRYYTDCYTAEDAGVSRFRQAVVEHYVVFRQKQVRNLDLNLCGGGYIHARGLVCEVFYPF